MLLTDPMLVKMKIAQGDLDQVLDPKISQCVDMHENKCPLISHV